MLSWPAGNVPKEFVKRASKNSVFFTGLWSIVYYTPRNNSYNISYGYGAVNFTLILEEYSSWTTPLFEKELEMVTVATLRCS